MILSYKNSVRTILKRNVRNVPVVDDQQRLVGLITRANVVDIVYDTIWGDSEDTVQAEYVGKTLRPQKCMSNTLLMSKYVT